ncbi:MAG TPA: DNA recombination protein RmuC [Nitrospirota bacterium]|nr:DNA recombination protein RmuC [Nitrospirota bacterium]
MTAAILILLASFVLILLWLVLQSQKKTVDPTVNLLQQEVQSLRGQLTEAMQRNQETVNQQLGQFSNQVSTQLVQVTNLVNTQLGQVASQMNSRLGQVTEQLQKSTGDLNSRLDNAARVVQEVSKGLGSLGEATQKIFLVGKDIASLQEILRSPKLRGGLGELFLGDLLAQIFPLSHYALQHRFKSGEAVDAVIKLGSSVVPVDAKFPLENFKRVVETATEEERRIARKRFIGDVKKHIDAIAGKYILPDEGTFDFALMYIPAENVYYELIIKDEAIDTDKGLLNYAFTKRVIPVSPNSFYAYLQTILLGLKGMHIEEQAQEILRGLERLSGDFDKFKSDFELLGKHLTNMKTKYDDADKRLEKFSDRLQSLSGTEPGPVIDETKKLPL